MVQMKAVELIFITLNHNITFIGKLWLVLFIFLRVVVLIFAGFPLFHDEEERFVCNTIQPGCVNMCYDLFAPLSLCRFWFLHMVFLCVPPAVYSTYHTHGVLSRLNHHSAYTDTSSGGTNIHSPIGAGGTFTGAYLLHLGLRMFLEVFFGMGQCFLFGLSARQTFTCSQMPCASVECFTSRPTEKSFLQQRMLGNVVLSLLISVADLLCVLRQESGKRRGLREGEERERKMRSATLSFGCFKEEKSIPVRRRTPTDHAHVTSTVASPADATRVNSHPPSHSPEGSSEMGGSQVALFTAELKRGVRRERWRKHSTMRPPLPVPPLLAPRPHPRSPGLSCSWNHYRSVNMTTEQNSDSSEEKDKEKRAWV